MPRPRLIHPINVTVERLVRSELIMDDDAREPIHGLRTTTAQTFTIPAQIKWDKQDNPDPEEGGARNRSTGYILCRPVDLDNKLGANQRLKRGDRITAMGVNTGLDIYITGTAPMGHYPDQNGHGLIKYFFEDRKPVQQRGDL